MPAGHPQIAQREQRQHLRTVLGQTAVARLDVTKLPLDHAERMLDGSADRGLDEFDLFGQIAQGLILDRLDLTVKRPR